MKIFNEKACHSRSERIQLDLSRPQNDLSTMLIARHIGTMMNREAGFDDDEKLIVTSRALSLDAVISSSLSGVGLSLLY